MKHRKARTPHKTVYVRCEGQTEEYYFEALKTIVNDADTYFVQVVLHRIRRGDPQGGKALIEATRNTAIQDGYDEAWVVFDHDRVALATLEEMIQEARHQSPPINIAFSHRAFEHWVLLHFEQNRHDFPRADCTSSVPHTCTCHGTTCLLTYLQLHHIPDYRKALIDIYQRLIPHQAAGFRNAAWLRWQQRAEGISHTGRILTVAPYTDLDLFVGKLLGQPAHRWAGLNVAFSSRQGRILIREISANQFEAEIQNIGRIALHLHADKFRTESQAAQDASVLVNPGETRILTLVFPGNIGVQSPIIYQPDHQEVWYISRS